ncbi:hypothetical protein Plhal710r2_c039g0136961 [Plasmopara halstedii]
MRHQSADSVLTHGDSVVTHSKSTSRATVERQSANVTGSCNTWYFHQIYLGWRIVISDAIIVIQGKL